MDESKNKTIVENPSLVPLAVAAGSKCLLESLGAIPLGSSAIYAHVLLGTMLAVGAFYIGKLISCDNKEMVENHQGTTTIHIDNVTINLNAEMVQQLNMNPKEVINQFKDQIQQASLKAIAQKET